MRPGRVAHRLIVGHRQHPSDPILVAAQLFGCGLSLPEPGHHASVPDAARAFCWATSSGVMHPYSSQISSPCAAAEALAEAVAVAAAVKGY